MKEIFALDKQYQGWSWTRTTRHLFYWGFWLLFYCVINGSLHGNNYLQWAIFEAVMMTIKLPYAYFIAFYLLPKFIPKKNYMGLGIAMIGIAFFASILVLCVYRYYPIDIGKYKDFSFPYITYVTLDLLYMSSFVVVIKLIQMFYVQQKNNAILSQEKVKSELQILRNQLQPHFLFNTLNNIYSLVISDDKQAASSILKLSDILSYMLYDCNVDQISTEKEVQLIKNYIELEKIRYGDRLELSFSSTGNIQNSFLPPLLLIPFLENAFKHGIAKTEGKSWMRVVLNITENELNFMVENNIPNTTDGSSSNLKSGIGLENIQKRLNIIYPERHEIKVNKEDSYLVKLKIQL
ncbi:MAG: sensor histidine kinase [Reichenbachiella sp.]